MRRLLSFSLVASLGRGAFAAEPAAPEPSRYWDPGNPSTSRVHGEVRADDVESSSDGVYGRFEKPLNLEVHAGTEIDRAGGAGAARVALDCFFLAGVSAACADPFGGDALAGSRVVSFGVDVRPAFIPRWSK